MQTPPRTSDTVLSPGHLSSGKVASCFPVLIVTEGPDKPLVPTEKSMQQKLCDVSYKHESLFSSFTVHPHPSTALLLPHHQPGPVHSLAMSCSLLRFLFPHSDQTIMKVPSQHEGALLGENSLLHIPSFSFIVLLTLPFQRSEGRRNSLAAVLPHRKSWHQIPDSRYPEHLTYQRETWCVQILGQTHSPIEL